MINLQAPAFSGEKEEWSEFIVKFQTFLVMKGCTEAIQTNLKSKLPTTEDKQFDASDEIEKAIKLAKIKNAIAKGFAMQCLSGMAMLNAILNVHAEASWPTGRACQLFDNLKHT